ncbi:hypothetical protein [Sphingomonas sp.]|jgi:hypothetical protein|uniref:hypothetical protein n=1 Tax=Sphingomonas sp. TaxID=28214 RepID=UPI002605E5D6|nr:hypothetical protein [Sphingomonas sp.]MDF2603025.1 hypothetical protein [Sphingomonas sp.]
MKALLLALPLAACAGTPPVNLCKDAELRRTGYTAVIRAADLYLLTGRPVPAAVSVGREAAVMALAVLNARCQSEV